MNEIFPILFCVLFCFVLVWFFLCVKLFKALETRHPKKYEEMGKPSLFMNNSMSGNIAFMRFLFKRESRNLDDTKLDSLSKFILIYISLYFIGFSFLFVSIPLGFVS